MYARPPSVMKSDFDSLFDPGNLSILGTYFSCAWSGFCIQTILTRCCRGSHYCQYRLWAQDTCNFSLTNVGGKMFSWSGFWHYIKMASSHLTFDRSLLNSVLERKLALTLKALLVLEAIAKVTFIVWGETVEKRTLLRPRNFTIAILIVIRSFHCASRWELHTVRNHRYWTFLLVYDRLVWFSRWLFQTMSVLPFRRAIPLAYGALLLILALYKARALWMLNGVTGSRLVVILIRDQVLYYVACVLI